MGLDFIENIKVNLKGKGKVIVLPEAEDVRILEAAERLTKEGVIKVVLLGNKEKVEGIADVKGFDISGIELIDPRKSDKFEYYVDKFVELRNGKNTREEAIDLIKDVNYFGTMMVQLGDADGMVSGAIHTTGDTVRPALQIIKTKPGITRTSGCMVLLGQKGEKMLFADVAINTQLDSRQMAEVTISSIESAKVFGIDPVVALLSYSTNGSAKTPETVKVAEAAKIAKQICKEQGIDTPIDGEMQFDAAVSPEVASLKYPLSNVAGKANTFIFPNLESGNIGYKIAQRLGGLVAVGPILQGLNKPVNDLSRGCVVEDVYLTCLVTAAQAE